MYLSTIVMIVSGFILSFYIIRREVKSWRKLYKEDLERFEREQRENALITVFKFNSTPPGHKIAH